MIEAAFAFGIIIFAGMFALLMACPPWLVRWTARHHLFTSLVGFGLVLWIHWGTMTGLMSATVAGLIISLALFVARWYWRIT